MWMPRLSDVLKGCEDDDALTTKVKSRLRDVGVPARLLSRVDSVRRLKTLLKTLDRYSKRKAKVCRDPNLASKLSTIKLDFAKEFGLTAMCLDGVDSVSDLIQLLEAQLIIDPEEGDFLYLNHLVEYSEDDDLKREVRKLSLHEDCDNVRNNTTVEATHLPWAESWAAQHLPVRLRKQLRKDIAEDIAGSTDNWEDCRRFLQYLAEKPIQDQIGPGYMEWLMGSSLELENTKTSERVEQGLVKFESKANDVGLFSNVNQFQTHIVKCLIKSDLKRVASQILTKYCISHF